MTKSILALCIVLLGLIGTVSAQAQRHTCGVSTEDGKQLIARMVKNRLEATGIPVIERGAVTYVPIHFHLVASSTSAGRQKEWAALDQLCDLNNIFALYDIQFYLSAHPTYGLFDKSINQDNVYTTQTNTFLMQLRRHPNAVNVFVTNAAASGNNQPGTTLAYYTPAFDWVVSRKDQINGSGNGTLAHELGHFFSLPHTFQGWETDSFSPTSPTWPKAPVTSPNGIPNERQNGSNCATAGDMICDTPPDYNFGFVWGGCSPYTAGAQDPLGTVVDPMENNFMSYFQNCANYIFTPNQVIEMKNDLASSSRNYLDNTFAPTTSTLTIPSALMLLPAQNEVTANYDKVIFTWAAVPEATHYLLEVDIAQSFISPKLQSTILGNVLSDTLTLEANKTYYWRVRPFNVHTSCGTFSPRSFKTGTTTDIDDLPQIASAEVSPNPVSGSVLNLNINAIASVDMQLRLTDAAGRVVMQNPNLRLIAGENTHQINTEQLANGIYYLSLTADGRTETKLVSVVR
jgi:Secretion system C-terminal sorting domain